MTIRHTFAAVGLAAACALFTPAAQASDLWLHVTVDGKDDATVTVNLPLSFVESIIPLIPQDEMQGGKIRIDDAEFSSQQLRAMWQAVHETQDATFVTVREEDQTVNVSKSGNYLLVKTSERSEGGAQVNVKVPMAVVDALFTDVEENEINIAAALRALAAEGEGELATVSDGDSNVRIWVDSVAEAR